MNLGIIGNGRMGKAIYAEALKAQYNVPLIIDKKDVLLPKQWEQIDLAIEVSVPTAAVEHITFLCKQKVDLLIVTTGWYHNIDTVRKMIEEAKVRALYSTNYSIGVNVYFHIVEAAARIMNKFNDFDVWGHEIHHNQKVDSPSGTAKHLAHLLLKEIARKDTLIINALQRKINANELHFSSTRAGAVNFEHTVGFDSEVDSISINHRARNRNGYAQGVIACAKWLKNQSPGLYNFNDFFEDILN